MSAPRIDTTRRIIDATLELGGIVRSHVHDLHALAYDRKKAAENIRVNGGNRDYALDTHGDPQARALLIGLARQSVDTCQEFSIAAHDALRYLRDGQLIRRPRAATATEHDLQVALQARERRRERGEYTPFMEAIQQKARDVDHTDELTRLRSILRKMEKDNMRPARSRLTPTEQEAYRRAFPDDAKAS